MMDANNREGEQSALSVRNWNSGSISEYGQCPLRAACRPEADSLQPVQACALQRDQEQWSSVRFCQELP